MFQIHHLGLLMIGGAVSFLLLLFFLIPLLRGFRHAGTVTGTVFCLLLMTFFCGNMFVGRALDWVWEHDQGHIVLCILIGMVGASLIADVICGVRMLLVLRKRPKTSMPAIVLHGDACEKPSGRQLKRRICALEGFLTTYPDAFAVLCGSAEDQSLTEAALVGKGISSGRIRKAQPAASLQEQLQSAVALLEEDAPRRKTALVTESYRQYRASLCAKELGLNVWHLAVKVPWYLYPGFWIRESILLCARFL